MSYQPYPSGGAYQPYPAGSGQLGQRPEQPTSVRNAVWLMYGGAALSALSAILVLALSSSIRTAEGKALATANNNLRNQGKTPLTLAQIHSVENVTIAVLVVVLLIGVGLWVWMAWANGRGRNWARIVAAVLFGFNTIGLFSAIIRPAAFGTKVFDILGWLVGLGATIYLWRAESTQYYEQAKNL